MCSLETNGYSSLPKNGAPEHMALIEHIHLTKLHIMISLRPSRLAKEQHFGVGEKGMTYGMRMIFGAYKTFCSFL